MRRRPAARLQKPAGGLGQVLDVPVLVDERARRRKLLERFDVAVAGGPARAAGALANTFDGPRRERYVGQLRQSHRPADGTAAGTEDAVLLVERLEQVGVGRLRYADEE